MRQLASSWNVLPTQSLARVRVTGFYQVEFIDCLSSVNVCLNWKKMAAEWWPVSIEEINSEPETSRTLYTEVHAAWKIGTL